MILYHGSNEIVEYPEIRKAKYNKYFCFGFCLLYEISRTGRTLGYTVW